MTYTHEANEKNWYTEKTNKHTHTKENTQNQHQLTFINGNVEYFYDK